MTVSGKLLALSAAVAVIIGSSNCKSGSHIASEQSPGRWPPLRPGYVSPIPAENALAGSSDWLSGRDATAHEIEGYADHISARAGDAVGLQLSSSISTTVTWILFRLGWYGGAGARIIRTGGPLTVGPQAACPMEAGTGLVRCSWTTNFRFDVGPEMVSGLYAIKLVREDGKTRFIPLVVTDDRPADLLFQASVQTYEAYNAWGGESLYRDASRTLAYGYAAKVSFDRPFDDDRGLGQMLKWEAPMARFLERHGYDVSYGTNVDVATRSLPFVDRAGMFLSVGHDEYWAGDERQTIERARDEGVPLAFFSANTGYWKIRYDDWNGGVPRTVVCYKQDDDPLGPTASGLFRGRWINKPENALLGVMYENTQLLTFPFVGADTSTWLFRGTGFEPGDSIRGMVGFEYDRRYVNQAEPSELTELGRSPLVDSFGRPGWSEAVSYHGQSGALVFAGGSIDWSRALDPGALQDNRAERITANVLHEGLGLSVPPELVAPAKPISVGPVMGPVDVVVTTTVRGLNAPAGIARVPAAATSNLAGSFVIALPRSAQVAVVASNVANPTVIAGDGVASTDSGYDAVPGLKARFHTPVAVTTDGIGRIYVADSVAEAIRRIDVDAAHTTTTLAGALGVAGMADGTGDTARFSRPSALAVDPSSSTLYVADTFNHRVRAVDLQTRVVTTIAGSSQGDRDGPGATALFSYPTALAVASDGRIFVIETGSRKVKVIYADSSHTTVTLIVGGDGFKDGSGNVARISPQVGAAWSGTFLAISDGPNLRVRAFVPGANATSTQLYTLAFSGRFGFADGAAVDSEIGLPMGMAADSDGTVYVADGANGSIRAIRSGP